MATQESQLTSDAEIEEVFQKLVKVAAKQGFSTWSPALKRELLESELNRVSSITQQLRELKGASVKEASDRKRIAEEKVELWRNLKVETFAQCVSLVWGISLLNAFLSIQLMIVARISTLFDRSNREMKYHQVRVLLERELERSINHFMQSNLREISAVATEAAEKALESLDLKRQLNYQDLLSILACISSTTEYKLSQHGWSKPLFPVVQEQSSDTFDSDSEGERQLQNFFHSNVRKVVEGQDFEVAVSMSARCISGILMSKCEQMFMMRSEMAKNEIGNVEECEESKAAAVGAVQKVLPLAKVIPLVSSVSQQTVSDCDMIIEYEVSKLPEVIRSLADAFSVHVAA